MTTLPTAGKPIYYRDFIIVPVFILLQYTFPLLAEEVFPNLLERHFDYTLQPSGYNILFNVMMCLAQVIVIAIFMLLHRQHVVARIKTQLIGMRQHLWRIIIVYLLLVSFIFIYQRVIPPMTIQDDLITIPLSFVTIGILTPIVEELLFRHLIIGELGKKWGFRWMAVVSIIAFGAAHFLHFTSIWTFVPYMVGGIAMTYIYIASGRNILVAIALHTMINSVSQILSMLGI
ncbi:CPBP family intramembrane metalloprotease [Staphylococcus pseudintermedius]|uniref:CPBP family intramembrane glutamic endopeptidase n=1 Tax=Staphylococcus pseudintermedius TaxID=283734 RepID=UPI00089DB82F|nr:CPBP family intramembrane glutamic endopeptidase [Staphylococcus pseudintermedius]EGQ1587564.1 CPBP family intramembrane metalloprotease [Staphylococcus pseudintermedius]EGQ1684925.1 CPBP family intramembrane metalloprotease [Staphylococcus pseudintermedius]EGQ1732991.1 CPBP family intramembrane metalloprotease [Staphylococcus pseudintermedius]EGQ1781659.1 CPBP family intramembrane metalloprotease [Staphylococcus pseudintermedius]EGQ2845324.1 CPBP family intramembrane metalloprotease [Staph